MNFASIFLIAYSSCSSGGNDEINPHKNEHGNSGDALENEQQYLGTERSSDNELACNIPDAQLYNVAEPLQTLLISSPHNSSSTSTWQIGESLGWEEIIPELRNFKEYINCKIYESFNNLNEIFKTRAAEKNAKVLNGISLLRGLIEELQGHVLNPAEISTGFETQDSADSSFKIAEILEILNTFDNSLQVIDNEEAQNNESGLEWQINSEASNLKTIINLAMGDSENSALTE